MGLEALRYLGKAVAAKRRLSKLYGSGNELEISGEH